MFVQCYELMKIPSFKNAQLVAGESGLERRVTWVYVLMTRSLEGWVHGGEILFVANGQNILQIFKEAVAQQLSAVVVLKSENDESYLNEEIITLANKEQLPLFELNYHTKLLDLTKEISTYILNKQEKVDYLNQLLRNLLFATNMNEQILEEYMLHIGINESHECFITTIQSEDTSKLTQILGSLQMNLEDSTVHFHSMIMSSYIVIFTFTVPPSIHKARELLKSAFARLNKKFPSLLFMGIGNTCSSLYDVHTSFRKSIKCLSFCTNEERFTDYENLGFSRLLLSSLKKDELKEYADLFLKEIKEYDEKNKTFFLQTVEAYILNNGNINKMSAQLYIHRNTCIYRLSKIKELFQMDLDNPYTRADILNSLSIYRFLDNSLSIVLNESKNHQSE